MLYTIYIKYIKIYRLDILIYKADVLRYKRVFEIFHFHHLTAENKTVTDTYDTYLKP